MFEREGSKWPLKPHIYSTHPALNLALHASVCLSLTVCLCLHMTGLRVRRQKCWHVLNSQPRMCFCARIRVRTVNNHCKQTCRIRSNQTVTLLTPPAPRSTSHDETPPAQDLSAAILKSLQPSLMNLLIKLMYQICPN